MAIMCCVPKEVGTIRIKGQFERKKRVMGQSEEYKNALTTVDK